MNSFAISFRDAIVTLFGGKQYSLTLNISGSKGGVNFLVGPNGAGKTLALKSLAYLFRFALDPIRDISDVDLSSGISFSGFDPLRAKAVFLNQNPSDNFDSAPLADNIRDFLHRIEHIDPSTTDTIVKLLSEEFHIKAEDLTRLPNQFSSGQQQVIAIALRFIVQPDFILLDEPFARLSRNSIDIVMNFCTRYIKNSYIIGSSHENDLRFSQTENIFITKIKCENDHIMINESNQFVPLRVYSSSDLVNSRFVQKYLNIDVFRNCMPRLDNLQDNYVIFIPASGEPMPAFNQDITITSGRHELTHSKVSLARGLNLAIGDNGSGKTLIARALAGEISFKGILFQILEDIFSSRHLHYVANKRFFSRKNNSEFKISESFFITSEPRLLSETTVNEVYRLCQQNGQILLDEVMERFGIGLSDSLSSLSYGTKKIIQMCLIPDKSSMVILDEPFGNIGEDLCVIAAKHILSRVDQGGWRCTIITSNRPIETMYFLDQACN